MFVRNGQKLGSVLVDDKPASTGSKPAPKSKETPKKTGPAKRTGTGPSESLSSAWDLKTESAEKPEDEKGGGD